jgi:hypothetical protein
LLEMFESCSTEASRKNFESPQINIFIEWKDMNRVLWQFAGASEVGLRPEILESEQWSSRGQKKLDLDDVFWKCRYISKLYLIWIGKF